jgi:signal transduction histidine kinase
VLGFAHEQHEANGKFSEQEKADLIELMAGQSQEVANIVDDLLIAARAETGSITVSPEAVPVRSLVGEVLPSHSGRVDFSMSSDEDVEVWADPVRTRQVLRNLRTNADLYGGNKVMVHVTKGEDQVSIEVLDDGEGIPESMQDHVFEPYARAHNGRSQPASVGLGLSVARSLAQLMDGDLVLSCDDGWTVFTVALHSFQRDEPPGPPPNVALDNRRIVVRV